MYGSLGDWAILGQYDDMPDLRMRLGVLSRRLGYKEEVIVRREGAQKESMVSRKVIEAKPRCSNCEKYGHTEKKCWSKGKGEH